MKDLMIAAGRYTNKDGVEKTRWVSLGVMMENEKGPYLLLEPHINLAAFKEPGKDRVIVSVFERDEHANRDGQGRVQRKPDAAPAAKPAKVSTDAPLNDEIPW